MSAALDLLRQTLQQRFPDAVPLGHGLAAAVASGIAPLDAMLPGGGLARGRVTLWQPGGGATAVLRSATLAAVSRGERSAWVDGGGQLAEEAWPAGVLLLRPRGALEALVCAEELLRCGGFALVVLGGGGSAAGGEAVRLGRAARAGGAAFVLVGAEASVAHMRVRSRIAPEGYRWRRDAFGAGVAVESVRVEVEANSLGWSGRARFEVAVREHAQRLALEAGLVDRRGAPAAVRWRGASAARRARVRGGATSS